MSGELEGRVAIVTGAAGGIGREFVRGLLGAGAKVAALDKDEDRLADFAAENEDAVSAGRLAAFGLDIADNAACEAAVERTRQSLGGLHILVNNGAVGMGVIRSDHMTNLIELHEIEPEVWDRFVAVNLSGAWYMTRAAAGGMLDQGWGRIVNVTTSFFTMLRGRFHPYGPAKAGLEAMSAGHAAEFAGRGVTVNVVVPGGPGGHTDGSAGVRHRPLADGTALGDGAAGALALLLGGGRLDRTPLCRGQLGCRARPRHSGGRLPRPHRVAGPRTEPGVAGRQAAGVIRSGLTTSPAPL